MTENQRIREVRKENNLTMEAFGERLGITKSAVSLIESGRNAVTTTIRRFISREFHVREEWLETGRGDKYAKQEAEAEVLETVEKFLEGEAPEMKLRLVKVLSGLTDKQLWILEAKLWEILTGEILTQEQVQERIMRAQADTSPPEPPSPHGMTREEAMEAAGREWDMEHDASKGAASGASGSGNSGTDTA